MRIRNALPTVCAVLLVAACGNIPSSKEERMRAAFAAAKQEAASRPNRPRPREDSDEAPPSRKLHDVLSEIASRIDGQVSIAVGDVESGRACGVSEERLMPQHSTFKVWVAVAAAHAIEQGTASWDDALRIEKKDLVFSYQPIAEEVGDEGADFTLAELVRFMLVQSDNPSTDAVIAHIGGVSAIQKTLREKALEGIEVSANEAELSAAADALKQEVANKPTGAPELVRELVATRPNKAKAIDVAEALSRLVRGELLGAPSTERLLGYLKETETGQDRLPAGLSKGYQLAHKTGTGPDVAGVNLGTNDIGIIWTPAGRRLAVAVFIAGTTASPKARARAIADVARAVVAHPFD